MSEPPSPPPARPPDELSPVDYLMHRGEAQPATRSAFLTVEILDRPADWGLAARGDRPGQPGGHQDAAEGGRPAGADHAAAVGRRPRLRPGLPPAPGRPACPGHAAPAPGPGRADAAVAARHLPRAMGGDLRGGPGRGKWGPRGAADQAQPRDHRRSGRGRPVRADLRHRTGRPPAPDAPHPDPSRRERRGSAPRQPQAPAGDGRIGRPPGAGPCGRHGRPPDQSAGNHRGRRDRIRRFRPPGARPAAGAAVSPVAPAEPGEPDRRARGAARRPARRGQGGGRLGERRLPRGAFRRPGPVPPGAGGTDRRPAADPAGQPAHRRRPGLGQPVRRRHHRRADRRTRPRRAESGWSASRSSRAAANRRST